MATVSERTGRVSATQDENGDGAIDRRDDEIAADRLATPTTTTTSPYVPEAGTPTTYRSTYPTSDAPAPVEPAVEAPITPDNSEVIVPVGPRPRASGTATLSLILGVLAGVAVITGNLAGVGIALGVLAALFAFAGIAATGRRHVAGKTDALLGMLFGLAAIVFGVLLVTNTMSWLSVDTNLLTNLHTWLQSHASWLLPS